MKVRLNRPKTKQAITQLFDDMARKILAYGLDTYRKIVEWAEDALANGGLNENHEEEVKTKRSDYEKVLDQINGLYSMIQVAPGETEGAYQRLETLKMDVTEGHPDFFLRLKRDLKQGGSGKNQLEAIRNYFKQQADQLEQIKGPEDSIKHLEPRPYGCHC